MNHLNSILIEGNLLADPLLRSSAQGTPVCATESGNRREASGYTPAYRNAGSPWI
ncbi:MAG: single-stranded DNA-binding protein [Treponema sp.]|jgi:hypothetical protein|nr:single-stranded DNA-binding protein [Treponema sp.]